MMSENIEQLLQTQLAKDIPALSREDIGRVIRVILGHDIDCSMDKLASSLIASEVGIGYLLAAMLRCEWISLKQLIGQAEPEELKQQIQLFSSRIERFNMLQEAIIVAADNSWRTALESERQSRVLAECKNSWYESKVVHLHNYFQEIPVSAKVAFLGFEDHRLRVKMTPELARVFTASVKMNSALVSNPDDDYCLRVKKDCYADGELTLLIASVESSGRGRRQDMRVHLVNPLAAVLDYRGTDLSAEVVDISCSGLGVALDEGYQLALGDIVQCSFSMGNTEIDHVQGKVCWLDKSGRILRAGIRFCKGKVKRELIYKFLLAQEQEIIRRIRRLPAPDWITDKD